MSEVALARPIEAKEAIRVLIVDDSAVARAAFSQTIDDHPAFRLVGAFDGARRAIEWLQRARADVILLDLEMPGLNGFAALPDLLAVSRGARILVVSSIAAEGAAATLQALALGATDALAKPIAGGMGRSFAETLVERMLRLGEITPVAVGVGPISPYPLRQDSHAPVECLAIGASTGGLHALAAFFGALPESFDAPILVTQHLPPIFVPFFADQLATMARRPATVARPGSYLRRGEILVAPGDAHLACGLRDHAMRADLMTHDVASRCRPSVDPMFSAVAECFGPGGVGVVLSGMGRDGALGAEHIVTRGGTLYVQDDASSAVWGMPGAVARAGLATRIAPPAELAGVIARRGSLP